MKMKLWWVFTKSQIKKKYNNFKKFMTIHRKLSDYPRTNKFLTTVFLIIVDLYIVIPLYHNVINTFDIGYKPIIIQNTTVPIVLAKDPEVQEEVKEETIEYPMEVSKIVDGIYMLESSAGKNNYSKCKEQGKVNHFGFGIPGNGQYLCFDNHEEEVAAVSNWVQDKINKGFAKAEIACYYNTGIKTNDCEYAKKHEIYTNRTMGS